MNKIDKNDKNDKMEQIITEYKIKIRENLINTYKIISNYYSIDIFNQYLSYVDENNYVLSMNNHYINLKTIVDTINKIVSNEQLNKFPLYQNESKYEKRILYLTTKDLDLYEMTTYFSCEGFDETKKYLIAKDNLIQILQQITKIVNDYKNKK